MKDELTIRVPYADTDQMGMVYYSNYLVYFERGRTEWLRNHGLTYREMEEKGIYIPVIEASCKYIFPARYDDELKIVTAVSGVGPASVEFSYEIFTNGRLITKGKTRHPLVNRNFKPIRLPDEVQKIFLEAKP